MLDELETFCAVCHAGSFSKAGRLLKRAPSTITRQVTRLEEELQGQLLVRSTHRLELTPLGETVLSRSAHIFDELSNLKALSGNGRKTPRGSLKISCFQSLGQRVVSPLLDRFLAKYPLVQAELELSDHVSDIASDRVDLAIRIGEPKNSQLKLRRLATLEMVLCASPGYLEACATLSHPQELNYHNCLCMERDSPHTFWFFQSQAGSCKVRVKGNLTSRGGAPLIRAARDGLGIVLITRWGVSAELASGELLEVLPGWTPALSARGPVEIFALFKPGRAFSTAARAFLNELVQECSRLK